MNHKINLIKYLKYYTQVLPSKFRNYHINKKHNSIIGMIKELCFFIYLISGLSDLRNFSNSCEVATFC